MNQLEIMKIITTLIALHNQWGKKGPNSYSNHASSSLSLRRNQTKRILVERLTFESLEYQCVHYTL
jgi:hypothetical protein